MSVDVLAPAHGFAWLPLSKMQHPIARELYDRYCALFNLPRGGNPGGQVWLAIVEMEDDRPGKLGGVLGLAWEDATRALEVTGLYVYPTRRGARGMDATIRRIAELYDAGHLRFVCCHVLVDNPKMERRVEKYFAPRGGKIRAHLWTGGSIERESDG